MLPPWGVAEVVVTAFNDMPGTYSDDLECMVEGAPLGRMPLKMGVKGCPLSLVKGSAGVEVGLPPAPSWLRFSDVLIGSPEVTKLVRVKNDGPIGALVTWDVREPDDQGEDTRVVEVALETTGDAVAPVKLGIKWREAKAYDPPYRVTPSSMLIRPHTDSKFQVTLLASSVAADPRRRGPPAAVRAMMVLNAQWQHPTSGSGSVDSRASTVGDAASVGDNFSGVGGLGSRRSGGGGGMGGRLSPAGDSGLDGDGGSVGSIGGGGSERRSGGGSMGSSRKTKSASKDGGEAPHARYDASVL